ncbi:hypothetical protein MRX96_059062 [Rhipicephalus microplus]
MSNRWPLAASHEAAGVDTGVERRGLVSNTVALGEAAAGNQDKRGCGLLHASVPSPSSPWDKALDGRTSCAAWGEAPGGSL